MSLGPKPSIYHDIGKWFESDASLPERYYAALRKSSHGNPERRLMEAVLEDVVACLTVDPRYASSRQQRDFRDAKKWLNTAEDGEWIFSFRNICEAFGIDANYLRRGLNRGIAARGDRANQNLRPLPKLSGIHHKHIRLRAGADDCQRSLMRRHRKLPSKEVKQCSTHSIGSSILDRKLETINKPRRCQRQPY